jgi:DNA polymerase/3'-5' exonuclease PolX
MELKTAQTIAETVKTLLTPCCERIEVAGSIRRQRPFVHDIDIVLIPANQGQLAYALQSLGTMKAKGQKIIRIDPSRYGVALDIYVAAPQTWATLLLIRTGSKNHNIRLCTLAKRNGMTLKADGSGLFKIAPNQTEYENAEDERVAGDTEESIFKALGLAYVEPEKRE